MDAVGCLWSLIWMTPRRASRETLWFQIQATHVSAPRLARLWPGGCPADHRVYILCPPTTTLGHFQGTGSRFRDAVRVSVGRGEGTSRLLLRHGHAGLRPNRQQARGGCDKAQAPRPAD